MVYVSKNERTKITHSSKNESHKPSDKQKKPDITENILYGYIFIIFFKKQAKWFHTVRSQDLGPTWSVGVVT